MAGFRGTYWREGRDRKRGRGGRDDTHRTSPEHGDGDGGGGGDGDGDRDTVTATADVAATVMATETR